MAPMFKILLHSTGPNQKTESIAVLIENPTISRPIYRGECFSFTTNAFYERSLEAFFSRNQGQPTSLDLLSLSPTSFIMRADVIAPLPVREGETWKFPIKILPDEDNDEAEE